MTKKNLLFVISFLASTLLALAQNDNEVSFKQHWFIQLQGGASHTLGEGAFSKLNSPAAAGNFGYKLSPVLGLRAGVSGWQAKGGDEYQSTSHYKFKYLQGNLDALFNVVDLFSTYNPKRLLNPYVFAGIGFNHAYDNDQAVSLNTSGYALPYVWNPNKNFFAGRGGVGLDIRISDIVAFNIEGNANILSDKFNSKSGSNPDWQYNVLAGFTIKLGKSYKKQATPPQPIAEPQPPVKEEPPVVKEEPKPVVKEEPKPVAKEEPKPIVKAAPETIQQNIFFKIGSSKIDKTELPKIGELIDFLNKYPNSNIEITGYADKETGSPEINLTLSEKRAEAVAKYLKEKGISAGRIKTSFKGDTVQPFESPEESRVAIAITK
jgi:outer membrane protein OmpA-like peptidoglycan-associated protein